MKLLKGNTMRALAVVLGLVLPLLACAQQVEELFWYGCGHCYHFEPLIQEWKAKLAEDVNFVGTPAVWRDNMSVHSRMFYAAKSMGVLEKLHPIFFDALNGSHRGGLTRTEEISQLVAKHGVDAAKFVKIMDSFAVNSQVQQAVSRQKSYKITGTPEMVVGGYYLVTTRNAGGQKEVLQVVDFLIDKLRAERGTAK